MKTIKYLSDGTIAKVGMRVKCEESVIYFGTGEIVATRNDYALSHGILVKPDLPYDSNLYRENEAVWSLSEHCTPIK